MTASSSSAKSSAASSFDLRAFWIAAPLLVLAGCFFYPLSLIVAQAFTNDAGAFSLATMAAVFGSNLFHEAILHTIAIALGASAGCLALGFVLAFVVSFVPFPGAALLVRLIDTVIALPTFLVALGFTFLYGSAGILNMSLMATFKLSLPP